VRASCGRCINDASGDPSIRAGIISAAGIEARAATSNTAPDDHFIAGPDRGVIRSATRRINGRGRRPTVQNWVVSSPSIRESRGESAPDYHLIPTPYRCVRISRSRCVTRVSCCPSIRDRIICATCVKIARVGVTTPHNHFAACKNCGVRSSRSWDIGGAGSCPTVGSWVVFAAGIEVVIGTVRKITAPHNHFTAAPNASVRESSGGRVGGARRYPTVSARIVPGASIQAEIIHAISTPHDHLATRPYGSVKSPCARRGRRAGSCPIICARAIPPASVYTN
jgi:hypothetical protein